MKVIALVYIPSLVRPMLYAHLGLIYSLLISTAISLHLGQLTQNDAIFALVTVASPASLSLWTCSFWSLGDSKRFPVQKNKPRSKEVLALKIVSFLSLAFELALICILFIPSASRIPGLTFSQPACNKSYGDKLWIELLWEFPYLINVFCALVLLFLNRCLVGPKGTLKQIQRAFQPVEAMPSATVSVGSTA
ncbi:hypothetical protein H0H92_011688 [Tricholoma furcatifolium]|nr:hypothetical protein H0H92_011688 [Tricholoma furcatifolium]